MQSANKKFSIAITILTTTLLALVLCASIMLAAFTASRQATTILTFADGIVLEVGGVNGTVWKAGTLTTSGQTTATPPTFDAVTIKVTKGPTSGKIEVYVRVFAIVYSTSGSTLSAMSTATGYTNSANGTSTATNNSLTAKEKALLAAVPSGASVSYIAVTKTVTAVDSSATTAISAYKPLASFSQTELGKEMRGIVVVSAFNGLSSDSIPASNSTKWDSVHSTYPTW
ncbi:MAG: hypothetical protein J6C13_04440 [Clostridia bacterium]|nr:hypothetical protein [Clostridia bacterium]